MQPRLLWLPVAGLAACQPAYSMVYLSVEQARQALFGTQTLTPLPLTPSAAQIDAIERSSGTRWRAGALQAWKAEEGYFFVDAVVGRHELITYAVALDLAGKVRHVEILEYHEAYGGEIRGAAWREQFVGRAPGDPVRIGRDIRNISGATLSCEHVTDGIRQLLAAYATLIAGR